jgi:SAM-dependent methyltransferase
MSDTFWDKQWRVALDKPIDGALTASWANLIDQRKLRFLKSKIPPVGTAVEVGCGSARLLAQVGRQNPNLRLTAVDESLAALQLAERTADIFGISIDPLLGTATALPLADDSVALLLSGGLLEHFPDPMPVLREMVRVIAPGGTLYADVVPRKISWHRWPERHRMRRSTYMADGVYESDFGSEVYVRHLEALGCGNIDWIWCGLYPPSIGSWNRRVRIRAKIARVFEAFDGTALAKRLGWYFMIAGRKLN